MNKEYEKREVKISNNPRLNDAVGQETAKLK
jgi:hypothetical protein